MPKTRVVCVREIGDRHQNQKKPIKPVAIRLKGQWLTAAGFNDGDHVEVHIVEEGHLVILVNKAL